MASVLSLIPVESKSGIQLKSCLVCLCNVNTSIHSFNCRLQRCSVGLAAGSRGARWSWVLPLHLPPQTPCSVPGYLRPAQGNPGGVGDAAGASSRCLHCGQTLQVWTTHFQNENISLFWELFILKQSSTCASSCLEYHRSINCTLCHRLGKLGNIAQ